MASIFGLTTKSPVRVAAPTKPVLPASPFTTTATVKPSVPFVSPMPAAPQSPFVATPPKPGVQTLIQNPVQGPTGAFPSFSSAVARPGAISYSQPIQQPLPFTSAAAQPAAAAPAPQPQPTQPSPYNAAFATLPGSFNPGAATGGVGSPGGQSLDSGARPAGQAPPAPERSPVPMPAPAAPRPYAGPSPSAAIDAARNRADNLIGPGYYEQWYGENKDSFNKPSALDDYWNGVKGTLTGQRFQPTYSADAYGGYSNYMNGPSQGVTNAQQVAGLSRNRGTGENMMGQAGDMFRGNTSFQNYANNQLNSGWFQAPSNSQQYYQQNQQALGAPGAGYNNAMGVLGGMNYGQQSINAINQGAGGSQNTQNLYNQKFPGFLDTNVSGSEYGNYFAGGLRGPSYSESLYESGNQGLNTFYDRERDKGMRDIENRMAAAGVFGSGDTATAMYELEGDLGASQARDMASLAQQADAARIARTGEARGWAGQIGDEGIARMGLGVQAAGQADQNQLALMGRQLEGYQLASNEANNRAGRYLDADKGERERMDLGGRLASSADQEGRLRQQLGLDTSRQVGEANDRNARGYFDTGREMSSAEDRRLRTSVDAGMQADQEERLRRENAWNASLDMEDQSRQWFDKKNTAVQTEGNLATQAAAQAASRVRDAGQAAQTAQNMQETRLRNRLSDISDAVRTQVDVVRRGLDAQSQGDLDLALAEIQNRVDSGALSRQQAEQQTEDVLKMIELGVRGKELLKPK